MAPRFVVPVRQATFGLVERLLYASFIAFLLVVAVEGAVVLG